MPRIHKSPQRKEILLTWSSAETKSPLSLEAGDTRFWILYDHSFPFDLGTLDVISRTKRFALFNLYWQK